MDDAGANREPVSEELVDRFLRTVIRFQRLSMKENRRPMDMPDACGQGGARPVRRLKHGESMILFAVRDLSRTRPDGVTVSELSRLLHVKPPSITAPLNGLEKQKFVRREQDREDRRVVRVYVTDEGVTMLRHMKEKFHARVRSLFAYLGPEKSMQMLTLLEEVYGYFRQTYEETDPR